jgi:hypothetical protein
MTRPAHHTVRVRNAHRLAVAREQHSILELSGKGMRCMPAGAFLESYIKAAAEGEDPPVSVDDVPDDVRLAVLEDLFNEHPDPLRRDNFIHQRVVDTIAQLKQRQGK